MGLDGRKLAQVAPTEPDDAAETRGFHDEGYCLQTGPRALLHGSFFMDIMSDS